VYVLAELAAGVAAALIFGLISRTNADKTSLREALTETKAK
jgi:hypothetical protein